MRSLCAFKWCVPFYDLKQCSFSTSFLAYRIRSQFNQLSTVSRTNQFGQRTMRKKSTSNDRSRSNDSIVQVHWFTDLVFFHFSIFQRAINFLSFIQHQTVYCYFEKKVLLFRAFDRLIVYVLFSLRWLTNEWFGVQFDAIVSSYHYFFSLSPVAVCSLFNHIKYLRLFECLSYVAAVAFCFFLRSHLVCIVLLGFIPFLLSLRCVRAVSVCECCSSRQYTSIELFLQRRCVYAFISPVHFSVSVSVHRCNITPQSATYIRNKTKNKSLSIATHKRQQTTESQFLSLSFSDHPFTCTVTHDAIQMYAI